MKRHTLLVAALAAVALAGPAAGQEDPAQRISAVIERARSAGLPVQLLESKVAEGRAKNVPLERIAAVVEQRATAMGRAQQVLRDVLGEADVPAEDVAVAADALQVGVAEAVVAEVAAASDGPRRTVAIAALAQLVADGVLPEEALARVRTAMERGHEALMNLPAAARRPEGAGPPAGLPATGRPAGAGRPPGKGPPEGKGKGGGPPGVI